MIAKIVSTALCLITIGWLLFSWADVVADNSDPNPHHSEYNAFVLMTK